MTPHRDWEPSSEQRALLDALKDPLPAVPVSLGYRVALAFVALAMVALPLCYVGLIGLAGWAVLWHATTNLNWLEAGGWVTALGYLAPMVVGGVLVLFMVKPLFAPKPEETDPVVVGPEEEPFLHAFVAQLARSVGAPPPREIRVDCEPNASASFRRGLWSFLGNDLVLTVGLPLVAGLRLPQLGGVLAHEFGHFAQSAGMRLTYVIRSVSHWFARVVYTRDSWDENLVRWSHEWDLRVGFMLWIARFFVWLTRKVLWVLMVVGHALSGLMLRQMELDADRYEAHLAGSAAFAKTSRQLPELAVAAHFAQEDLGECYKEGRLADDLPALILDNVAQLTPEVQAQLETRLQEERTGLLDTHPATRDRIASAEALHAPGRLTGDTPARILFGDFGGASRRATRSTYRNILGDEADRVTLTPIDEFLAQRDALINELNAFRRFYQDVASPLHPLPLPQGLPLATGPETARGALVGAREALMARAEPHREAYRRFDELDSRRLLVAQTRALLDADLRLDPSTWPLPNPTWTGVDWARQELEADLPPAAEALAAGEQAAVERLWLGLGLHLPRLASEERAEAEGWIATLRLLSTHLPAVVTLNDDAQALLTLAHELEANAELESLHRAILAQMERLRTELRETVGAFGEAPYPFEHGQGRIALWEHLAPDPPPEGDLGAILEAAHGAVERTYRLYQRLLGRLALGVEAEEASLGLEPLPEPTSPEPAAEDDPAPE